jgi:DNA topoisomerase-1
MSKHLIVVESPAKARTLEKFLGKDFTVLASYGHVRDLVPKEGAVDPSKDFSMKYAVIDKNQRHVDAIAKALKKADALYLATDPDREGEAISWHLYEILRDRKLLDDKPVHRVVFHEITRKAIEEAIHEPRRLSDDLVDAQQARRALDYLVGFNLSPLLWKKIRQGLSAGRVQSPALRMIVEREREIEGFKPREYWTIEADAEADGQKFRARLSRLHGGHAYSRGGRQTDRRQRQQETATPQSRAAVYDVDAPAGGIAQAPLQRPENDANRAASLRRHRRWRRIRGSDQLHAYRLSRAGKRSGARDAHSDH